jgi:nucleoside-diphosphate-sugar epimerase
VENFRWVSAGLQLLEAFSSHGGQRFVGVGSCAEYDWHFGSLSEATTPLNPATPYGICKHAFQLLSRSFAKSTGLSAAWGRLFFLYGPHEHRNRLVASVISSLLNEESALCSLGQQERDFLYVLDAADALVSLLDSDVEGPINIGSGEAISVADVVTQIGEQMGKPELIRLGAIPSPKNEPPLLTADTTRLKSELRWSPKYPLADGLRETIEWWKLQP